MAKINGYLVSCVCFSSYSSIPIPLKLYRCLDHGRKIIIVLGYNPQIMFCLFLYKMNFVIFAAKNNIYKTYLFMPHLLQFYCDCFETLQVFRP